MALTGWGQDDDRRRSEEAGFDAHLVKPVDDAVRGTLLAELGSGTQEVRTDVAWFPSACPHLRPLLA